MDMCMYFTVTSIRSYMHTSMYFAITERIHRIHGYIHIFHNHIYPHTHMSMYFTITYTHIRICSCISQSHILTYAHVRVYHHHRVLPYIAGNWMPLCYRGERGDWLHFAEKVFYVFCVRYSKGILDTVVRVVLWRRCSS